MLSSSNRLCVDYPKCGSGIQDSLCQPLNVSSLDTFSHYQSQQVRPPSNGSLRHISGWIDALLSPYALQGQADRRSEKGSDDTSRNHRHGCDRQSNDTQQGRNHGPSIMCGLRVDRGTRCAMSKSVWAVVCITAPDAHSYSHAHALHEGSGGARFLQRSLIIPLRLKIFCVANSLTLVRPAQLLAVRRQRRHGHS